MSTQVNELWCFSPICYKVGPLPKKRRQYKRERGRERTEKTRMRGRRGERLLISLHNGKINEMLQLMRQFTGRVVVQSFQCPYVGSRHLYEKLSQIFKEEGKLGFQKPEARKQSPHSWLESVWSKSDGNIALPLFLSGLCVLAS